MERRSHWRREDGTYTSVIRVKGGLDAESAEVLAPGIEVPGEAVMKRLLHTGTLGRRVPERCPSGAPNVG